MIGLERQVVLDTWVLLHLCRDDDIGKDVLRRYRLRERPLTPLISIVTVGEMQAFARSANWGNRKRAVLSELLSNLVIVELGLPRVIDAYADISTWLHRNGKGMGQQNDRWIAATARALDATVLTGDGDFDVLHPHLVTREKYAAT
jgi:predicted nucleic acid-binding protein